MNNHEGVIKKVLYNRKHNSFNWTIVSIKGLNIEKVRRDFRNPLNTLSKNSFSIYNKWGDTFTDDGNGKFMFDLIASPWRHGKTPNDF